MRHLSQQMLSMELRRPYLDKYRRRLRDQASRSDLGSEDRLRFRRELEHLGQPKDYAIEAPTWGIDPGPLPVEIFAFDIQSATSDTLLALSHRRLRTLAEQRGLTVSDGDTKAQIVQTILASRKEEQP